MWRGKALQRRIRRFGEARRGRIRPFGEARQRRIRRFGEAGFSLLELLVAVALMGMLGTLFVWFLVPSMRISGQQSARAELQQQAVLAVNRVAAVLQTTAAAGVSRRASEPVTVAAVPLVNVDSQGRQQWATNMTLFYWDKPGERLCEKVWEQGWSPPALTFDPGRPATATAGQLLAIIDSANGGPRSLARGVKTFSVTGAAGDATLTMPLNVTLELQRTTSQRQAAESYVASRVFTVRQSR